MPTTAPPQHRLGKLESASSRAIEGWVAFSAGSAYGNPATEPVEPFQLDVIIDGQFYGQIAATLPRPDVLLPTAAGFRLSIPAGLMPLHRHSVTIRFPGGGPDLTGSPCEIPAATGQSVVLHTIADAVAAFADAGSRDKATAAIARAGRSAHRQGPAASAIPVTPTAAEALQADRWASIQSNVSGNADVASPCKVALVIDDRAPDPNRDAGSRAILSHMQALGRIGYRVAFVAARTLSLESSAEELAENGIIGFSLPWVASVEEVLRRIGNRLSLIYIHRHTNLSRYAALIRDLAPTARLVCCVADLHFLRLDRQARVEGDEALVHRIPNLRAAELATLATADAIVTHSPAEARVLADYLPSSGIYTVPWHIVPRPIDVPFHRRQGVAFVGSFGHAPNRDAAEILVNRIMPLVHARDPTVECLLVGSLMPGAIAALARPGIIALDTVADMRQIWGRVRLTVAPLRYGAGLKGKILDSAAAGVPFVGTPTAVEGMTLPPSLAAGISENPVRLAEAILHLHWDQHANQRAAADGLAWISQAYSTEIVDHVLAAAVHAVPITA